MPISRMLVVLSLFAALFPLGAWAGGRPDTPIQVGLSSTTWTTVPLPAMPLGITEQNGVFWVAGADEMLARSDDQGHTWKLVHFKQDGQLLFAMVFAGNDGWAMGSLGMELHSGDDGVNWKRMANSPANVIRLVAADAHHLMASGPQDFLVSSNGGKSWVSKGMPVPKQTPPEMYSVESIAMPDADHAGALLERPSVSPTSKNDKKASALTSDGGKTWQLTDDQQILASTSDGGKTWQLIEFSSGIHIFSLSSDTNGYRAPGSRQLGESSQAVVFHSSDGTHWSTTSNKPSVYRCHRSACMLSGLSGWVQWDNGVAAYWKTPQWPMMANHWAAIPGVMCVVGEELQCALAQHLAGPPPEPAPPPAKGAGSSRGKVPAKVTNAKCLRCSPPKYPAQDRASGIGGQVLLRALIDKNGRIQDMTLLAAPSMGLAEAAMQAVRGWVYQPTLLNDRPVEVDTQITVNFELTR